VARNEKMTASRKLVEGGKGGPGERRDPKREVRKTPEKANGIGSVGAEAIRVGSGRVKGK